MGINIIDANQKAGALEENARQLANAKKILETYRERFSESWIGTETGYIVQGVNKSISELESAIAELHQLAVDIRNAAEAIRQEEIKQERIANAQAAVNQKQNELNNAKNMRAEAKKQLQNPKKYGLSERKIKEMTTGLETLDKTIGKLQKELSACQNNLLNAQRA